MGLFTPDDTGYDESVRMTGLNRYKQLLSFHAGSWVLLNAVTVLGAVPLAAGIAWSIACSSSLVMLAAGLLGGAVFGPFWAGLHDSLQRGFRDADGGWWANYRKSWKQNWKGSLIPGALMGLAYGILIFMVYILIERGSGISLGTLALFSFSAIAVTAFNTLYWPQLVLFDLPPLDRMRNLVLFSAKYLWKVLGASILQLGWMLLMILFMPFSLLVIPFLGFWYIVFVSEFMLYDPLNEELHIEELFYPDRVTEEADEEEEDGDDGNE